jgi:inosine-uridine nucleoside N-ribohydrolase
MAGRADVPVGMGAGGDKGKGGQEAWVKDYDLKSYAGKIHEDGVQALINAINTSSQPLTLISIGPSTTVAEALKRSPEIAPKAVFVGMHGSVRKGYNGGAVSAEWNVKANIPAAQKALLAPWKQTIITPLDTCGLIRLKGEQFKILRDSSDVLVKMLIENYRIWAKKATVDELKESSVLFDTVAVYLAYPGTKSLLNMEELSIGITDKGITDIDPAGMKMLVATEWKDLKEYENFLIKKLTSASQCQ